MQCNPLSLQRMPTLPHDLRNLFIEWICKADMADHASLKERKRSDSLRSIDYLIWDYEVARLDLFLQRAYGTEGNDAAYAD
jgi:hypothetical protein